VKRTTLTLDEDLLKQLKENAARQGKTVAALVNDLLRHAMAIRSRRQAYKLKLSGWEAELQPGVDLLDRDKLFDLMNGR
jgi:plasmid stability protein